MVFKSNTSLFLCQSLNVCVCVCCPEQNQLVDICEKMQLQAQRIERFINQTLTAKERALQVSSPVTLTLSPLCAYTTYSFGIASSTHRYLMDSIKSFCCVPYALCCVSMQVEASGAREQVVAQLSVVREAVEEEEQRLLEAVQREEERVEQCLLTQRAHWGQALAMLTQTRTRLVHTLTNTPDLQLAVSRGKMMATGRDRGWEIGEYSGGKKKNE